MGRLLVLMGSGETTPTMVTPHQRVLAAVGTGERFVLDTPYGFQENADELSTRTVDYFTRNVGHEVGVVTLRDAAEHGPVATGVVADRIADAAWVFAGPGSPSYLARQWLATPIPDTLRQRLADPTDGRATVFASAAACTVGRLAIPVYELYKVGEDPHWREGLDLMRTIGLDAIVVPHYDNAEGGTHDTSCCYVGDRRLRTLEADLGPGTWILGIDEHTAAVIDLARRRLRVEGRGRVVLRVQGRTHEIPTGSDITIDDVLAHVARLGAVTPAGHHAPDGEEHAPAGDDGDPFARAVASGDLIAAAEVTVNLLEDGVDRTVRQRAVPQIATLARIAQAGIHEHRGLVAPYVEALLELRRNAREERRFADADLIRDALVTAGIEVRDGGGTTTWEYADPLERAIVPVTDGRDGAAG